MNNTRFDRLDETEVALLNRNGWCEILKNGQPGGWIHGQKGLGFHYMPLIGEDEPGTYRLVDLRVVTSGFAGAGPIFEVVHDLINAVNDWRLDSKNYYHLYPKIDKSLDRKTEICHLDSNELTPDVIEELRQINEFLDDSKRGKYYV